MRERRVDKVGSTAAREFLAKADEFLAASESSERDERWDAAGLAAVHAGISFADAVLAEVAGIRSRETDHGALVSLLDERVAAFGGAQRRQLVGLLSKKTMVEYESRPMTMTEAVQLTDSANRLGKWARTLVK